MFCFILASCLGNPCCIPAGRGSIQQGSVRPDHRDVGVSSTADAQTGKNQVKGIHIFITITDRYRKGSEERQKGVGETKGYLMG